MSAKITATRYHDFCAGHRVVDHESKCKNLHGHNYRVHFTIEAESLDELGRVVDFSVIKSAMCEWLEVFWDHRMLLWEEDPLLSALEATVPGIVVVPFNPTAENMAIHLLEIVGPIQLPDNVRLIRVHIEETRKCSATAEVD